MKVNEQKIHQFIATNATVFVIPVYQRNYDWEQSHCKRLLEDIITVGQSDQKGGHFIGSIVHISDGVYSTSSLTELMIIDGQQRLTTLTLLYAALYWHANNSGLDVIAEEIRNTCLINQYSPEPAETGKLKLKPTENNKDSLKRVLEDSIDDYSEYSRIIENYKFFKNRINDDNFEFIRNGIRKLIFVEISLDSEKDNPQRIFESLNSTGLDLTQADLIRNYVLMSLSRTEQEKIYTAYWDVIEQNTRDHHKNENRISDFIRDYLTLKNKKIPKKSNVYEVFKMQYPAMSFSELETVLSDMTSLSKCYGKLLTPSKETDLVISKHLAYIKQLEIDVAYPFLMQVYADYVETKIDRNSLIAVLELVQSYVMRRFIVGFPSNALNKVFMGLYEKIDQTNYLHSAQKSLVERSGAASFPKNREVEAVLKERDVYNINSKNRTYLFERLENHNNNEPVHVKDNPQITTEHIFPQVPHPDWENDLSSEESSFIRENYLHTIGNLTLSGNNGCLGNQTFLKKRDMNEDGGEQGYRYSRLWLNRDLKELERWNKSEIETRTQRLTERFFSVWAMPAIESSAITKNVEVNIFDADDPTNKRLEYAIFFDQTLSIRNVTDLYVLVLKQLFDQHTETFLNPAFKRKIGLVSSPPSAGNIQYTRLNDMYFIKTTFSSLEKFRLLKDVLVELDCEEELIIKYA